MNYYMNYQIKYPTLENLIRMEKVAIEVFGVPDRDMVAPSPENDLKLIDIDKNTFVCFKENDEPIAWSLVMPTSRINSDKFLSEKINEKAIFEDSTKNHSFESLYLFVAIVIPEHRRRGLATELMSYQIKYFKEKYNIKDFYAWTFSKEGEILIKAIEKANNILVRYISRIK